MRLVAASFHVLEDVLRLSWTFDHPVDPTKLHNDTFLLSTMVHPLVASEDAKQRGPLQYGVKWIDGQLASTFLFDHEVVQQTRSGFMEPELDGTTWSWQVRNDPFRLGESFQALSRGTWRARVNIDGFDTADVIDGTF